MTSLSRHDGGYGWVIVFAFFLSEVVMDGIRFSFGMLYVEWLEYFHVGKGETAWIGSILIGVYNIGGPLFAVIVHKLGYRPSYILGALLSTVGYILCFFATDIHFLYISFGVLPGLGFGIIMLAGTGSVGKYFFKRRALAIGLSYSGSGIGTMIFNPLARVLLNTFGWRGAMFIYASLTLNLCVLGSLQRPFIASDDDQDTLTLENPDHLKHQQSTLTLEKPDHLKHQQNTLTLENPDHLIHQQNNSIGQSHDISITEDLKADEKKAVQPLEESILYEENAAIADDSANNGEQGLYKTNDRRNDIPNVNQNQFDNGVCMNVPLLYNSKGDKSRFNKQELDMVNNGTGRIEDEPLLNAVANGKAFQTKHHAGEQVEDWVISQTPKTTACKTEQQGKNLKIVHLGSNNSLPYIKKRPLLRNVLKPNLNESLSSLPSSKPAPLIVAQNMLGSNASFDVLFERQQCSTAAKTNCCKNSDEVMGQNVFIIALCRAFPKDLVTNANFVILMVATFFYGVAAYIPIALLPAYCVYVGCHTENTGWLISVFGVTGIVSRLLGGWITDLPCINRLLLFLSLILVIGVTTLLLPLLQTFQLLMVYAALIGLVMGAGYVVQPILLFEYFGDKYMVEMFGIMMLNYGLSSLIGTPIAGWLIDMTGHYNIAFLFAGANCIISVALHLIVYCRKPKPYTKENQLYVDESTLS